jgi:hypothetical protein
MAGARSPNFVPATLPLRDCSVDVSAFYRYTRFFDKHITDVNITIADFIIYAINYFAFLTIIAFITKASIDFDFAYF